MCILHVHVQASLWVPSIGFTLLFGSLIVKTWRIYYIFRQINAKDFNKAKFKVSVSVLSSTLAWCWQGSGGLRGLGFLAQVHIYRSGDNGHGLYSLLAHCTMSCLNAHQYAVQLCLSMEYKLEHHCKCDDFSCSSFRKEGHVLIDLKQVCCISNNRTHGQGPGHL